MTTPIELKEGHVDGENRMEEVGFLKEKVEWSTEEERKLSQMRINKAAIDRIYTKVKDLLGKELELREASEYREALQWYAKKLKVYSITLWENIEGIEATLKYWKPNKRKIKEYLEMSENYVNEAEEIEALLTTWSKEIKQLKRDQDQDDNNAKLRDENEQLREELKRQKEENAKKEEEERVRKEEEERVKKEKEERQRRKRNNTTNDWKWGWVENNDTTNSWKWGWVENNDTTNSWKWGWVENNNTTNNWKSKIDEYLKKAKKQVEGIGLEKVFPKE